MLIFDGQWETDKPVLEFSKPLLFDCSQFCKCRCYKILELEVKTVDFGAACDLASQMRIQVFKQLILPYLNDMCLLVQYVAL